MRKPHLIFFFFPMGRIAITSFPGKARYGRKVSSGLARV